MLDYNNGASAVEWVKVLDEILKLDFDTVIPGHGPLLNKERIRSDREKLVTMNQRMAELARKNVPLDQVFDQLKLADLGWDHTVSTEAFKGGLKGYGRGDEGAAAKVSRYTPGMKSILAAVATAVLVMGMVQAEGQQLQKITLNYPTRSGASWPLFIAKEGGYYEKQGLDATLVFAGHPAGIAMVVSDQAQMSSYNLESVMQASSRGDSPLRRRRRFAQQGVLRIDDAEGHRQHHRSQG